MDSPWNSGLVSWICGENELKHPKHSGGWAHPFFALILGALASAGLGILLTDTGIVKTEAEPIESQYDYIGWGILIYHILMIVGRTLVKKQEELYYQLWACNTGMAVAEAGILLHRPALVGSALGVVAIDQLLWYVDCIFKLTTGKFKIGVAKYLDWPETPFIQKVFTWHHLWFMPVCLYYVRVTGPGVPTGSLPLQICGVVSVLIVTRLVTPRDLNINMAFQFWKDVKAKWLHAMNAAPAWQFVPFIAGVYLTGNMILWPILVLICGGNERVIS